MRVKSVKVSNIIYYKILLFYFLLKVVIISLTHHFLVLQHTLSMDTIPARCIVNLYIILPLTNQIRNFTIMVLAGR